MRRTALFIALLPLAAPAQSLRGTANLSYQELRETTGVGADSLATRDSVIVVEDALSQEQLTISYDDVLWSSLMRLSANLTRREFPQSDYHEFRPIFYADLRGHPYTWTTSYSPYKRQVTDIAFGRTFFQHYRDFRTSFQLAYAGYPSAGITYGHNRMYRSDDPQKRRDVSKNLILQSGYQWKAWSLQGSYNTLDNDRAATFSTGNFTRTYSSSAGYHGGAGRLGSLSGMYNVYASRRSSDGSIASRSTTHSFNSMYLSPAVRHFSATAAYSVRYTRTTFGIQSGENSNQTLSGQLGYTPWPFLSFDATKNYQISDEGAGYKIVEYVSLGATTSRYLRRGIDCRLTINKTIFQRSDRAEITGDGSVVIAAGDEGYTLDTYFGSLGGKLFRHLRFLADGTVSHNNRPGRPGERYQARGTLDFRARLSGSLEGRASYTGQYQGAELKFGRVYAQSYNTGLTYTPQSNLNMNVSYIYNRFNSGSPSGLDAITRLRQTSANFTGYLSYTFRRVFTAYVSVNRQRQERREERVDYLPPISPLMVSETNLRPEVLNIQGVFYLTRRITTTLGYINQDTDRRNGLRRSESIQSVVNIQL